MRDGQSREPARRLDHLRAAVDGVHLEPRLQERERVAARPAAQIEDAPALRQALRELSLERAELDSGGLRHIVRRVGVVEAYGLPGALIHFSLLERGPLHCSSAAIFRQIPVRKKRREIR